MTDTLEDSAPPFDQPEPALKPNQARCPECGKGISKSNLSTHRKEQHGIAPAGKGVGGGAKRPAHAKGLPSFEQQVGFIDVLAGQLTAQRLPVTGNTIVAQSGACAKAWDQFLDRYPAVKEWMEKAGVAGDLVALFVAHWPIVEAARLELAAEQAKAGSYDAQAGSDQPLN